MDTRKMRKVLALIDLRMKAKQIEMELLKEKKDSIREKLDSTMKMKPLNLESLFVDISRKYGVGKEEIIGKGRTNEVMKARRAIIVSLKEDFGYTYERIGGILKRSHGAIISAYKGYKK